MTGSDRATFGEARWHDAWREVDARPPEGLHADLVTRYTEPHRAYHTLQHLEECFAALDATAHLATRAAEVELALWFHDAIYDTHAGDNEEQCAVWAARALVDGGAPADAAARVAQLVRMTKHDAMPVDGDAVLLVDIDLAILGAAPPRFAEYEAQVRHEYAWVPEEAFRAGRAAILTTFLGRAHIYGTPWFADELEARARSNLARSIEALGATAPL